MITDIVKRILKDPPYLFELFMRTKAGGVLISDRKAISFLYNRRFNRKIDFENPLTFNEKILVLSLLDRKPIYTTMVDKYNSKQFIEDRIGSGYTPKNLGTWKATSEIDFESLPDRYALKCNHDSGSVVVCDNRRPTSRELAMLDRHLKSNYFYFSREWPYKNIHPIIFAEEYISSPSISEGGLVDYKVFCFDGKPYMICVISNRSEKAKLSYLSLDWQMIDARQRYDNHDVLPKCPKNKGLMLEIAKKLSEGIPFLRVDFFEDTNEKLFVGELTFLPSSGLIPFQPDSFDYELGKMIDIEKFKN